MVIIAAVDRSEDENRVVEEAATLAEAFDDHLRLIHVLSRSEFAELGQSQTQDGGAADLDEIRETAAGFARKAAEGVAPERPYEAVGRIGKPAEEINKYAESHDARYVVLGGQARSPTGKALFGSVTQNVLLNSDRPVVTVMRQK
jgi:nucleotide-binding universal stress UspA family protein